MNEANSETTYSEAVNDDGKGNYRRYVWYGIERINDYT
jgi:hypothetical protein